jgi:antibiotic biosynthesis monooxygenase (ABM) superfamily enzyme
MDAWPLALRTLLISVLMVVALTWVVIPNLTRLFAGWLAPASPAAEREHRDHAARHRPTRRLSLHR